MKYDDIQLYALAFHKLLMVAKQAMLVFIFLLLDQDIYL